MRCETATVLGPPGVGKTRLSAELIARPVCAPSGPLPPLRRGDHILADRRGRQTAERSRGRRAGEEAIRSLLGETSDLGEAIAWAVRRLLEAAAPILVVFDDLQWAEETFLELVDHITLLSSGSPILLLCCGRPELLDRRPGWPVSLHLQPLPEEACSLLIEERLAGQKIDVDLVAASSAPLAELPVEEMVAMLGSATDADIVVPPTIQALLAAWPRPTRPKSAVWCSSA
jgi:hypothetical protein